VSADAFAAHRGLLFTIAYEILGSAADAEDVVQETWIRWEGVERSEVQNARAYLVRMVTRQALNRLRALSRRREDYVGEWLPEPLLTSSDVAEDVELVESISMAMLTLLETLSPVERAVFVLREVFDIPYDEVAAALDKSPAAVRQIAHRAREHVHARKPRMPVTTAQHAEVVERLLVALRGGDVAALLGVLSPNVVFVADSGGLVPTIRQPVQGADKVARLLAPLTRSLPTATLESAMLNGTTAIILVLDGEANTAVSVAIEDSLITHLYAMRNPNKLQRLGRATSLSRSLGSLR
jgi:RNA polymerase sigma-70 factor (TIGR02957 family)